jgi:hypothetical protein
MAEIVSSKLFRPCPFCGGSPTVTVDTASDPPPRQCSVICQTTRCCVSVILYAPTVDRAIQIWNATDLRVQQLLYEADRPKAVTA